MVLDRKEPQKREARPSWSEVPESIINKIENILDDKIIGGEIAWGGFSNSACFVVETKSGKKIFIKGTHPDQDAHGIQMLKQDISAYQTLPFIAKTSPTYLGYVEDGDEDGWALACFEYIKNTLVKNWDDEKLNSVFEVLKYFHNSPYPAEGFPIAETTNYIERYFKPEGAWIRIKTEEKIFKKFLTIFENEVEAKKWLEEVLPQLCGFQEKIEILKTIRGIAHHDLRTDNLLFNENGDCYLIDFPNICFGPVLMDAVNISASIAAESDFELIDILEKYQEATGVKFENEEILIVLATLSGHLADSAYRAVPEKLPRLRWMQKKLLWEMLKAFSCLTKTPLSPEFKE